ncbi:MAG: tetratricopeptide repeat protein, partial [Chloroflexi bacterium]
EPVAADPFRLSQAIEALRAYSLIQRDPRTQMLSVHRLVQAVLRDSMENEAEKEWKERAVGTVNASCPKVSDVTEWNACEQWLPHAMECVVWIEQEDMSNPVVARMLNQVGYYLDARARYLEAEPLLRRALEIYEQQLGADHPDTAMSLNNLAMLYQTQGKYLEAEPLLRRALEIYEQQLGADHTDTARSLNNLAMLYQTQGKYLEAEPLLRRALEIYEQVLGANHPDTQVIRGNYVALQHALEANRSAQSRSFPRWLSPLSLLLRRGK